MNNEHWLVIFFIILVILTGLPYIYILERIS